MDDNDVKAAASANLSDGDMKPGAFHITGTNSRNSTVDETGGRNTIDDNHSALNRKMQGERPTYLSNSCTSQSHDDQDVMPKYGTQGMRTKSGDVLSVNSGYQVNSRMNDDLEFGEFHMNVSENDVAVALPVHDEGVFTPKAVEYDSDAKPFTNRRRRNGLYIFVTLSTAVIGILGLTIGMALTKTARKSNDPFIVQSPNRTSTMNYRAHITHFVSNEELDDITNPYRKALDWISYTDPMLTKPDHPRFIQRYMLAYLYYATSVKQPWVSDCAPSDGNDQNNCIHQMKLDKDRGVAEKPAFRWLSAEDECEWAGLHCDLKSQIDTIALSGIGMTGTFPDGIINFPYLQTLTLTFGELEGPLPSFLGKLKNMHSIQLLSNKLTGTIPAEWFQSRSLQKIWIESNRITGTISTSMSKLYDTLILGIGGNQLTGTIPTEIGELSSLKLLSLHRNNFDGGIPTSIGLLQYLFEFDASTSSLSGTIPREVGNMKGLMAFVVDGNLLTGKIPESFWKATDLRYINLANNFLTGPISGKITTLLPLVQLIISNNQFTGPIPARLGQTTIEKIQASGNMFNGTIAPQLCDLVEKGQLEVLELDCAAGNTSTAEIICPAECCTLCCTSDGETCYPN